eukprot:m.54236 g.54236  ORF g.54236 m.54236 type:complete len:169 (+) comp34340_c0_seq10:51-557(+)
MQALTRIVRHELGISNIILSNPAKRLALEASVYFTEKTFRNALSLAMLESLQEALLKEKQDARVIILSAEGNVFSSGHNLKELTSAEGMQHHIRVFEKCSEVISLVQDAPVPVIAQVRGLATAAGCQLVASCDVAVAASTAQFATPGLDSSVLLLVSHWDALCLENLP